METNTPRKKHQLQYFSVSKKIYIFINIIYFLVAEKIAFEATDHLQTWFIFNYYPPFPRIFLFTPLINNHYIVDLKVDIFAYFSPPF